MTTSGSDGGRIPAVDGMRAVAVASVLLYHLDATWLPGGFTGVDVFFVISGYVISRSLAGSDAAGTGAFVLEFYRRRVLRILPAFVVCIVVTSILSAMFIPDGALSASNDGTAIWSALGASNVFLALNADGYFTDRIPFNPFVHTWSLGLEEQFYVAFPFVFLLWARTERSESRWRGVAASVLPLLVVSSLIVSALETSERTFYLLPGRFWELGAGALLFQAQVCWPEAMRRAPRWLSLAGATSLLAGFVVAGPSGVPFPLALLPVVGSLLILLVVVDPGRANAPLARVLASDPAVWLGRISYSLYLWHWPVFSLFHWTVGLQSAATRIAAVLLAVVCAGLSYAFVERGFLEGSRVRVRPPWRVAGAGALAIGLTWVALTALFEFQRPLGLNQSVTAERCWSAGGDARCERPAPPEDTRGRRLLVVGDSHANAYRRLAAETASRVGAEVRVRARSGCPIAMIIRATPPSSACDGFARDTLAWVDRFAEPGDIVLLASLRAHRLSDQRRPYDEEEVLARTRSAAQAEVRRRALAEAVAFVDALQALGVHVLIDAPKPVFRASPYRCSDWFNATNPACAPGFTVERELLLLLREPAMQSLRFLRDEHDIHLWDPFPTLCPKDVCVAVDGQVPLFVDGDHLSVYGNHLLADDFVREVRAIWGAATAAPGAGSS